MKLLHYQSAITGAARCGRQLHSTRADGAIITNAAGLSLTPDLSLVKCRHCLRAEGLLPPLQRKGGFAGEDDGESEDMEDLIRESDEEEEEE